MVGRPMRKRSSDAIAQIARIGPIEIHEVAGLERNQIVRIDGRCAGRARFAAAVQLAIAEQVERGDVGGFPFVEA